MPPHKPKKVMTETDPVKIQESIDAELRADLTRRIAKARRKKTTKPTDIDCSYVNLTIEVCRHRLEQLGALGAIEAASVMVSSHSAIPGTDVPSITVKKCEDAPVHDSPKPEEADDTDIAEEDAPSMNNAIRLAGLAELLFLPSPTRSPSPGQDPASPALPQDQTNTLDEFRFNSGNDPAPASNITSETVGLTLDSTLAQHVLPSAATEAPLTAQAKDKKKACKGPRPGPLSQEQLQELHDKMAEINAWILEKSSSWDVSTVTITTNMGIDNRERRARNFWNAFQTVFWDREIHANDALAEEGQELPEIDAEEVVKRCAAEYQVFRKLPDDATEEYIEAMKVKKAKILAQYEAMQEPNEAEYREGSTSQLMKQARKEFTLRANWYAARGVLIAGFAVSTDPCDALSHTLHFIFGGSDIAHRFFEEGEINVAELLYYFETFCASGEMKECIRKADLNPANSALLRTLWQNSMKERCSKVPWDDWATDTLKQRKKTVGWPDKVPWPSGPEPYVSIGRGDNARSLHTCLVAEESRRVRIVDWSDEEKKLAETLTYKEHTTSSDWLKIPLVVSASGTVLLRVGEMKEQAKSRASGGVAFTKETKGKVHTKKEDVEEEEDKEAGSEDDDESVSSKASSLVQKCEVKRSKPATKPKPKPKTKATMVKKGKKRESSEVAGVEDGANVTGLRPPSKRHKSRAMINDSDEELAIAGSTTGTANIQSGVGAETEQDRGGAENQAGLAGGCPQAVHDDSHWMDNVPRDQAPWQAPQVDPSYPASSLAAPHALSRVSSVSPSQLALVRPPSVSPPRGSVTPLSVRPPSRGSIPPHQGPIAPHPLIRPPSRGAGAPQAAQQLICPPSRAAVGPGGGTSGHNIPRPPLRGNGVAYHLVPAPTGPPSRFSAHTHPPPPHHVLPRPPSRNGAAAYVSVTDDRAAYQQDIGGAHAAYQDTATISAAQPGYLESSEWSGSAGGSGSWHSSDQSYEYPGHRTYSYAATSRRQASVGGHVGQYGGTLQGEYYHVGTSADTSGRSGISALNMIHGQTVNAGHAHIERGYVPQGYGVEQWDERLVPVQEEQEQGYDGAY
ncbi:hypothetical protein M422DRAFT_257456 [Sphaerobolus stellatus SS14]|uniref:Uncharacterized protein n=1 Tax=Sphaerobolus stellatus (strain SS14) TaxID=990650 RepID=A0A0C9VP66_SPHS4|nr:hypothetical protein M422DRAFT_257456 [Sphaerobolus stellatus SS14]